MSTHLTDCLYRVLFRRYRPLNLPLGCEVSPKSGFGPRFVGGRDTPDFGHTFSNYTYFRPFGRISFSSVQRAPRLEGENKERKKEERKKEGSLVKYKSADNYVGRPNKCWAIKMAYKVSSVFSLVVCGLYEQHVFPGDGAARLRVKNNSKGQQTVLS